MAGKHSTGSVPAFLLSKPVPKPSPAVRRGELLHVVGPVAFAEFRQAACAWSALDAERVEAQDAPLHPGSSGNDSSQPAVMLRHCDDCALNLGRDVLRALGNCPRWGKPRHGVESRCPAFVAKDGAR